MRVRAGEGQRLVAVLPTDEVRRPTVLSADLEHLRLAPVLRVGVRLHDQAVSHARVHESTMRLPGGGTQGPPRLAVPAYRGVVDEQPEPTADPRAEKAAARARIEQQQTWVDLQVRQAMERGEFDDLPGAGKSIPDLGATHDPDWWVKRLVEREIGRAHV